VLEILCSIEGLMPDMDAVGRLTRGRLVATDLAKAFAVWAIHHARDESLWLP